MLNKFEQESLLKSVMQNDLLKVVEFLKIDDSSLLKETDSNGNTALHWAIRNSNPEIFHLLISKEIFINSQNFFKETPLHFACKFDNATFVYHLLKKSASLEIEDSSFLLPIHIAAKSNSVLSLKLILEHSPNMKNLPQKKTNRTPLHWAALSSKIDAAIALIEAGALIDMQDSNGSTPLHLAAKTGSPMVDLLMMAGADPKITNQNDKTPRDIVVEKKHFPSRIVIDSILRTRARFPELSLPKNREDVENSHVEINQEVEQNRILQEFKKRNRKRGENLSFLFFLMTPILFLSVHFIYGLLPFYLSGILITGSFVMVNIFVINNWRARGRLFLPKNSFNFSITFTLMSLLLFTHWFYAFGATFNSHPILNIILFGIEIVIIFSIKNTVLRNPGKIEGESESLENAIQKYSIVTQKEYCYTCKMRKPLRSKHDTTLGYCVARYDHYCSWMYNVIGFDNHREFISSIISSTLATILLYILIFFDLFDSFGKLEQNGTEKISLISFFANQYQWCSGLFLICIIYFSWLSLLVFGQLNLISKNLTTNERINFKRYFPLGKNPYNLEFFQKKENRSPEQALVNSIIHGTKDYIELIKKGTSPNIKCEKGFPALVIAAMHNRPEIVKNLINLGANIEEKDKGITPLGWCCFFGIFESAKILIENGANINFKSIYVNLKKKQNKRKVENGIEVHSPNLVTFKNQKKKISLHCACIAGSFESVQLFVENGAQLDIIDSGMTPLFFAVKLQHIPITEYLLSKGANPNIGRRKNSPLGSACKKGNLQIIEDLLKYGANVNFENSGFVPLFLAIQNKKIDVIKLLIRYHAKLPLSNETILDEFLKDSQIANLLSDLEK
ncbi:ankyrin repeat-containing protein [Anaeramoeba ignava]|uniref:Palmitoyltransferase n=1 Tax=Anaeramoeba ignava TaxID=1746090 RepID=A0A9Q0LQ12_ANAIG|nr:ankyrin repeat-containing protein [Anaeramoeba ignava]